MERQKKVIDASVALKWFLNEVGSDSAIKLRSEHIEGKTVLIVPELLMIEVLNAVRYKEKDLNALIKINTSLWEAQLHVEKINEFILQKSAQIAMQFNLTMYDAIYAALANIHGAPLITADKALLKIPNVMLLE